MEATTARDANKDKALDAALTQIERQFGKGAMMRLGDTPQVQIPSISTGSLGLDVALGIGGLPKGRIVEIYGPESSGKTTLTLQVIAEAQKAGGTCAFIDAEHALDPIYAQNLGVDIEDLLVSQPDTGEQALEICDMVVRSGAVDVVVIDSVAALTPKAEIEGDMGDHHVGLQARLMSQALRKMAGNIKNSNTLVIFINQIRMKIGVMFGSPETTTGGNALKFYSSVRLDIRRIGAIKEGDEIVGNETRVKVIKNKVAPPFKQTEFQIMYGKGIYRMGEVVDMGVQLGLVGPLQPRQHGLNIGEFNRSTTPNPQACRRVTIGTNIKCRALQIHTFGHSFCKYCWIFDPWIGELQTNRRDRTSCRIHRQIIDPVPSRAEVPNRLSVDLRPPHKTLETSHRFSPIKGKEIVFHTEHRRRVARLAPKTALNQFAALGQAENLRHGPGRCVSL